MVGKYVGGPLSDLGSQRSKSTLAVTSLFPSSTKSFWNFAFCFPVGLVNQRLSMFTKSLQIGFIGFVLCGERLGRTSKHSGDR